MLQSLSLPHLIDIVQGKIVQDKIVQDKIVRDKTVQDQVLLPQATTSNHHHHGKNDDEHFDTYAIKITGVSTDSRTIKKGDLFIALCGANYDGHHFIQQAVQQGAVAVLASRKTACLPVPVILVQDSLLAYGLLAKWHRQQFTGLVIAITGSNGKTSVKQMLFQLLHGTTSVYAAHANYNNEIGVPCSLLQLESHHLSAVFELGARKTGDIAYLSTMVQPDIAVITNIGESHLAYFGSQMNIARTKSEIVQGLRTGGSIILPYDTPHYPLLRELAQSHTKKSKGCMIVFSLHNPEADIYASQIRMVDQYQQFTLQVRMHGIQEHADVMLPLFGKHHVYNFIAAAAVCIQLGDALASITAKARRLQPVPGRLEPMILPNGHLLINDSYNASPSSVRAAIDVLCEQAGYDSRVLILADMLELGEQSLALHQDVGRYAAVRSVDVMLTLGPAAQQSMQTFKERHTQGRTATAENLDHLYELVCHYLTDKTKHGNKVVLLVKGSHGMQLQNLVQQLMVRSINPAYTG